MAREWTCIICCNDFTGQPTVIEHSEVCKVCIRKIFADSITSELNFPPRWGTTVLDPWDFEQILDRDFLREYKRKEDEWTCPDNERIYCRHTDPPRRPEECGNFLGRWLDRKKCQRCDRCMWYTCLSCRDCFSLSDSAGASAEIEHDCDPSVERDRRERAFSGLVRGKHYQDCPKCQRRVELKEACTHMTCLCGTEFCYLCGRRATKKSGHWGNRPGQCPLYPNGGAVFAAEAEAEEEDDFEDAEELAAIQFQLGMMMERDRNQEGSFGRTQGRLPEHRNHAPVREQGPEIESYQSSGVWINGREMPLAHDNFYERPPRDDPVEQQRSGTVRTTTAGRASQQATEYKAGLRHPRPRGRSGGRRTPATNNTKLQRPREEAPDLERSSRNGMRGTLKAVGGFLSALVPRVIPSDGPHSMRNTPGSFPD